MRDYGTKNQTYLFAIFVEDVFAHWVMPTNYAEVTYG